MIRWSKTLVISLLLILQKVICSPVTIILREKDRQCFYIVVEEKATYMATVLLLSGGSVGFSEYGPTRYKNNKLVPTSKINEKKIEMNAVMNDGGDDSEEDDDSNDGSSDPSPTFMHKFKLVANEEHEICLFSDRRFGREAKRVILYIAKETEGDKQSKGSKDSNSAGDLALIEKDIQEVGVLVTAIRDKQDNQDNRLSRRNQAADDNHNSMEQSSLMETVVLVVVSVGQIIFVRRWFQGKGTLLKQWA